MNYHVNFQINIFAIPKEIKDKINNLCGKLVTNKIKQMEI